MRLSFTVPPLHPPDTLGAALPPSAVAILLTAHSFYLAARSRGGDEGPTPAPALDRLANAPKYISAQHAGSHMTVRRPSLSVDAHSSSAPHHHAPQHRSPAAAAPPCTNLTQRPPWRCPTIIPMFPPSSFPDALCRQLWRRRRQGLISPLRRRSPPAQPSAGRGLDSSSGRVRI